MALEPDEQLAAAEDVAEEGVLQPAEPVAAEWCRPRSVAGLGLAVAVPLAVGAAGSVATSRAVRGWYRRLARPAWNPPEQVFGPVWTALYLAMGFASWRAWRRRHEPAVGERVPGALAAYGVQLALNAAWSPVFFGLKRVGLGLAVIAALLPAIAETARRFWRVDRGAAMLMAPYLAWVAFATALNARIWWLNR